MNKLKLLSRSKIHSGESKFMSERNTIEIKWMIWGSILLYQQCMKGNERDLKL